MFVANDSGYSSTQGSTKFKHLVTQVTKFCTVVPNTFSIITAVVAYKNAHQFPRTEQKVSDNSEVLST